MLDSEAVLKALNACPECRFK